MKRGGPALFLALLLSTGSAMADWTASGVFQYSDRGYDASGFTGFESNLPIRFADVQIVDVNAPASKAVIGSGATDAAGVFVIQVIDSKIRDVYARVVTSSTKTPDLNVDVRDSTGSQSSRYSGGTPVTGGHNPGVNLNFGTATLQIGQGGEPFNIYDQLVKGADYAAYLNGARPTTLLPVVWGPTNGISGSFFNTSSGSIILRDSAGYDDTVVLHEMGHFITREYSSTSTTSGAHTFAWCDVDIRLSFDEGWATFWGNSVIRHFGGPNPHIYTRTNGAPGAGNLVRSADLENDTQYLCQGASSEVNVFTLLWDIVDGASTNDATPGVDDPHDLLDLDDHEMWEVFTDHIPGATGISLEDFWDGWFLPPVQNGYLPEMIAIAGHVEIEYTEDTLEPNDSVAAATPITPGTPSVRSTFFHDPELDGSGAADEDYFAFDAASAETYIIETLALLSGADTKMYLFDTDGTTVLAINDDRTTGDPSSRLDWTAPASGTYYARVFPSTGWAAYGSYSFRVSPINTVDDDGDGYISALDCDDTNPGISPGADEACNFIDDDCDGATDEGFDEDFDGFTSCNGDCDDSRPGVHPNASEVPTNGLDDNCDGMIDEGFTWFGTSHWRKAPMKPASGDD